MRFASLLLGFSLFGFGAVLGGAVAQAQSAPVGLKGNWQITQIRCEDRESEVGMFTDKAIRSDVVSLLRIDEENGFRSWAVAGCTTTTPMKFSALSDNSFFGSDGVSTCEGNCAAFAGMCNVRPPLPDNQYTYVLRGDTMVVTMPEWASVGMCGAGKPPARLTFTYTRK